MCTPVQFVGPILSGAWRLCRLVSCCGGRCGWWNMHACTYTHTHPWSCHPRHTHMAYHPLIHAYTCVWKAPSMPTLDAHTCTQSLVHIYTGIVLYIHTCRIRNASSTEILEKSTSSASLTSILTSACVCMGGCMGGCMWCIAPVRGWKQINRSFTHTPPYIHVMSHVRLTCRRHCFRRSAFDLAQRPV